MQKNITNQLSNINYMLYYAKKQQNNSVILFTTHKNNYKTTTPAHKFNMLFLSTKFTMRYIILFNCATHRINRFTVSKKKN